MIYRTLAIMTIVMMGALSAMAGYMFVDRSIPTEIIDAKVLTKEVEVGQELKVRYTVDRKRFCSTVIQRWIFDYNNYRYSLETKTSMTPGPLGEETFVTRVPLPDGIVVGDARFRVILVYQCNPIQAWWPIVQTIPDMPFKVVR